jgi:hypothetical protein
MMTAIIGTTYVIGLLIVNMELARHGVWSLDLGRAEYVTVGVLWLVLTGAAVTWFLLAALAPELILKERSRIVSRFFSLCVLEAIGAGLLLYLPIVFLSASIEDRVRLTVFNGVLGAFMAIPVIAFSPLIRNWQSPAIKRISGLLSRFPAEMCSPPIGVLSAILAIALYALGVYPYLSKTFGGGQPPIVNLVLKNAVDSRWPSGIQASKDGNRIGPVALLLETDGFLVISAVETFDWGHDVSTAPRAIEINKDQVSLVLH